MSWWREDTAYLTVFDLSHVIYVFILVGALGLLIGCREKVRANQRNVAAIILTISILQQVILYSWQFLENGFNVSEALPLHISRISSLLGIYYLLTKNTKVLEILFYFGLFAYGSFSYPKEIYPAYHIMGISFVINHAITILLPYFGLIVHDWWPTFKGYVQAYGLFVLYFASVYVLNPIIDGNYFYLENRPFFQDWPDDVYVPTVLITVLFGYLIVFLLVRFIGNKISPSGKELPLQQKSSGRQAD